MVSRRYTISVCSLQTAAPLLPLPKMVDTSSVLLKGVPWLYACLHFAVLGQFTCWNALITRTMSTFSVNRQSWIQDLRNFNFSQKEADIGHKGVISQKKHIYTFFSNYSWYLLFTGKLAVPAVPRATVWAPWVSWWGGNVIPWNVHGEEERKQKRKL